MRWIDQVRMAMVSLFWRRRATERLDTEMQFHLEQEMAERVKAGITPDEARRVAMREFGNPAALRDEARRSWSGGWIETVLRDVRFGARSLARSKGFSITAIVVMALCIGATTSLFTIVRSVLLKPLPFREPERLVAVYEHFRNEQPYNPVAAGDYLEWRAKTHGFEDMAAWQHWSFNLSGERNELPEVSRGAAGSWNLLNVLGVEPALGRTFRESEDRVGGDAVVMLTWSLFQRRFGGDPSVIGRQIRLDAKPHTIVGVLPSWFTYPEPQVQLWVPYASVMTQQELERHDDHGSWVIARMRPDVSLKSAMSAVSALQYQMHMQWLGAPVAEDANARPLLEDVVHDVKTPLMVMSCAVVCMLLIGCLNVSNLLVARAAARQKETAIRGALGAGRAALIREQMTETLIICAAGGAFGLLLAMAGTRWLTSRWHDLPRADAIHVDGMVLLFTASVICIAAFLAGLLPALSATSKSMAVALQDSSRSVGGSVSKASLRKVLLTAEIALTVVLLVAAGLLLKSFVLLRTTQLGCTTDNVLTMAYSLPEKQYSKPEQRVVFTEELLDRVKRLPGVRGAGLVTEVPGEGWGGDSVFTIPEHPIPDQEHKIDLDTLTRMADPGYFSALQIPLIEGRFFDNHDRLDRADRVIVSKQLVRQFFPGESAVGKHLSVEWNGKVAPYEIVGVVGDTVYSVREPIKATMYFPALSGVGGHQMTLAVRTDGDPLTYAIAVQKEIAAIDPGLPVVDVLTIPQIVGQSTANANFSATLVLLFAGLSLLLAGVGLYGVLSYLVTQRVTEIGIRIALGAQREQVLGLILRDGLRPVAIGLAVGVVGAAGVGFLIRSMLYGTKPLEPVVFMSMVATLMMVAVGACAVPAWRASSIDPMQALRAE
jgi:predicted permease